MATIPAANFLNNAARTEGEFKLAMEDFLAGVKQIPGAGQVELTNTIASGSITPAGSGGVVVIDTEAAAATDDLTNIVTTNYPDGSFLLLRNSNAARFVVAKHLAGGVGQMNLATLAYTLDDTKKWLMLQRRGADWHEIFRAPFPVVPVENPIINASMEVWQRGTAFTAVPNITYTADRWMWGATNTAVININRSTNVPTVAQAGVLFNYSLEVDVTTADATIAAGDYAFLDQKLEGFNWRHFAQRQFTLSFWVQSSKTGTHGVAFRNVTPDRSYVAEYTVNVANAWEFKTVTVSASPSAGTWDYANSMGLEISFVLACGSTFQTTANAWQTGNFIATSGQVNVLDNAANFFRITGVKMELGATATPLAFVPFEVEFDRCKRYYQKSFPYLTAPAQNGGDVGTLIWPSPVGASVPAVSTCMIVLRPVMRAAPTITLYNPNAANAQVRNLSNNTDSSATTANNSTDNSATVVSTNSATTAVGHTMSVHWAANAEL